MSQYAQISDLQNSLPGVCLDDPIFTADIQNAHLIRASGVIDSYLASRYTLPLSSWGSELTDHCCAIAAYKLMCYRGFSPNVASGEDNLFRQNYQDAIKWLEQVSKGWVTPSNMVDTSNVDETILMPVASESKTSIGFGGFLSTTGSSSRRYK